MFTHPGFSEDCVDPDMKPCEAGQLHDDCVGKSGVNFVYRLMEKVTSRISSTPCL